MRLDCKIFVGIRRQNGDCTLGKWSNGYLGLNQSNSHLKNEKKYILQIKHNNNKMLNRTLKINQESIQKILTNCINMGKATIFFNFPSINVFISNANSAKLRCFISSIQQILEKNTLDENCMLKSWNENTSSSHLQKLHICTREKYISFNGFPQSLFELKINKLCLKTVDLRWFQLNFLKILDISQNCLGLMSSTKDWRKFENIKKLKNLEELNLSENNLIDFPKSFYDALPISLRYINLSKNQIVRLSEKIGRLKNLHTILINFNNLSQLPEDLCLLNNLRFLCVSDNKLQTVPGTLFCRQNFHRFTHLDLSGNYLLTGVARRRRLLGFKEVPTLCQITASVLINNANDKYDVYTDSDFLPLTVRYNMRKWLRRCTSCFYLFPRFEDSADQSKFMTIQMGNFAELYSGPSNLTIEYFYCKKCFM